jgi:hypothetical protein
MRKLLALTICFCLASTLVVSLGCEKKEEKPPVAKEEVAPVPPEATSKPPGAVEKPQVEEKQPEKQDD